MADREKKQKNSRNRFLTLNFNNEFIKVCEASKTPKGVVVHKAFLIPTPPRCYRDGIIRDRNALAKQLKIAFGIHSVFTTNTIMSISSSKIATKEVIIPAVNKNKIKSIIDMNATEYFPLNIEEYLLEYTILEKLENPTDKKDSKLKLLVAAIPAKIVDDYYDLASTMGLHLKAIDYAGNSTMQILKQQVPETGSNIVVHMENDATIISVFSNNVLQLQRTVPYGKSMVVTSLMQKQHVSSYDVAMEMLQKEDILHTDFDGDEITDTLRPLTSNIGRIIDYQVSRNSNKPVEKIYLVGNATTIKNIDVLFNNTFGIPIEPINTLKGVTPDKKTYVEEGALTSYIVNIGSVINPVNFLPKAYVEKSMHNENSEVFKVVMIAAVIAAGLLIFIPYVQMNSNKHKMEEEQKSVNSVIDIEVTVNEYNISVNKLKDVMTFKKMTYGNNDALLRFLNELENTIPSDVYLKSFSVKEGVVSMVAYGSEKEAVQKFIMQLKNMTNVAGVTLGSTVETIDENGVTSVAFPISCVFYSDEVLANMLEEMVQEAQ